MRPLHTLQCFAWALLVVAVISAFGGGRIAHSVHDSLTTIAARFTHAAEIGASR